MKEFFSGRGSFPVTFTTIAPLTPAGLWQHQGVNTHPRQPIRMPPLHPLPGMGKTASLKFPETIVGTKCFCDTGGAESSSDLRKKTPPWEGGRCHSFIH